MIIASVHLARENHSNGCPCRIMKLILLHSYENEIKTKFTETKTRDTFQNVTYNCIFTYDLILYYNEDI